MSHTGSRRGKADRADSSPRTTGPGPVPARRRTRRPGGPRPHPPHPRPTLVRPRPPDPHVHGDTSMFIGGLSALPAPVHPPARHGSRGRALRLPRRPMGPTAENQHLPGRDDLRNRRRRPTCDRPRPCHPRTHPRHDARWHACHSGRPAPARLGPRRRDRQLPTRPRTLRSSPAGRRVLRRLRRRHREDRRGTGRARPPRNRHELAERLTAYRPELRATSAARAAARFLLFQPPLPVAVRPFYRGLAANAVVLLPPWARGMLWLPRLPVVEDPAVRPTGQALTRTIRWAMNPQRPPAPPEQPIDGGSKTDQASH